jgi:hypothetical protein
MVSDRSLIDLRGVYAPIDEGSLLLWIDADQRTRVLEALPSSVLTRVGCPTKRYTDCLIGANISRPTAGALTD